MAKRTQATPELPGLGPKPERCAYCGSTGPLQMGASLSVFPPRRLCSAACSCAFHGHPRGWRQDKTDVRCVCGKHDYADGHGRLQPLQQETK